MHPFVSTTEAAKILGISRVAVFQQIKSGRLPAEKVGRNYLIKREDLPQEKGITESGKTSIEESVNKTIKDYGETLKLLKDA
jgi:excisionase family DNA binding protein